MPCRISPNMPAPTRAYRLKVCTTWLPPGGSCHDEISASRNRYFVVTDEGWRWLKVSDFHVGWRKPGHIPSIQLHSLTNLSPPLISLATLSSFPPGEAKGKKPYAFTIHPTVQFRGLRADSAPTVWVGKLLPFNEPFYCVCWRASTAAPTEGYAKGEQKRAAGAALFFKHQYVTSLPMGQS